MWGYLQFISQMDGRLILSREVAKQDKESLAVYLWSLLSLKKISGFPGQMRKMSWIQLEKETGGFSQHLCKAHIHLCSAHLFRYATELDIFLAARKLLFSLLLMLPVGKRIMRKLKRAWGPESKRANSRPEFTKTLTGAGCKGGNMTVATGIPQGWACHQIKETGVT